MIQEPFDNPDYVYALKHDCFRAVVYLQIGECDLISRNFRHLQFLSLRAQGEVVRACKRECLLLVVVRPAHPWPGKTVLRGNLCT